MDIQWNEVEAMTTDQIENLRVQQQKELTVMEDAQSIVQEEIDALTRKIALLEIEKGDKNASIKKSRTNIRNKRTNIEILQTKYWQAKRG